MEDKKRLGKDMSFLDEFSKEMEDMDNLKMTDSEDDEGAGERVRKIMEEIFKNQDKIKTEKDIEDMAERCTNMMSQMRNDASRTANKKSKKPHRASGSGDKASPPPSRSSAQKDSPRRDSTKLPSTPRIPGAVKSSLKNPFDSKQKGKLDFSEMYKEKMDKLRVPSKMDTKGTLTKTDSIKPTKPKAGMPDSRRKMEQLAEISTDSDSDSDSSSDASDDSGSGNSEELKKVIDASKHYEKMMKDLRGGRDGLRGKEAEAHKKATEWMSSAKNEQAKKKDTGSSSKMAGSKNPKAFYSSSDSDSEDDRIAQHLKSKMTLSSTKKGSQSTDAKDTIRKMMAAVTEKKTATTPAKIGGPSKKPAGSSTKAVTGSRAPPASDKTKLKKKT